MTLWIPLSKSLFLFRSSCQVNCQRSLFLPTCHSIIFNHPSYLLSHPSTCHHREIFLIAIPANVYLWFIQPSVNRRSSSECKTLLGLKIWWKKTSEGRERDEKGWKEWKGSGVKHGENSSFVASFFLKYCKLTLIKYQKYRVGIKHFMSLLFQLCITQSVHWYIFFDS